MRWRLPAAAVFVLWSLACSQDADSVRTIFSKSVRFYTAGVYDSTISIIRGYLKEHGKGSEAEYLVPLIMEAFLRKEDFNSVNRLFDLYRKKYRSSPFMPRVHYLHACAQALDRSLLPALKSYSQALDGGVSVDLDSCIMKSTDAICGTLLSTDACREAARASDIHPRLREIAGYHEIDKLLVAGDTARALKCVKEFGESYPGSRFEARFSGLPAVAASRDAAPAGTVSVGLLAPLTGDDADIGRRMSQGVRLAIDKYNFRSRFQIRLVTADTRGQLLETARQTQQIIDRDRPPLIIGPLLSSTAIVAASIAVNRETVLLTPTATDDGIAELGPVIFQMNITLGVLARKIARYALNNLNIREFAIVAPQTSYGTTMASVFMDEVTKNGGTVFDEQLYEEGGNDFSAQFRELRGKLLLRKLNAQREPGTRPFDKLAAADSVKYVDTAVSIGAIFMPGDAEDIVMLAPQVSFNRIKAQLLGSNGWYSPKTVSDGRQYVQNAFISMTFEPDSTWKKWPDFRKEYLSRFREEPDRVSALGFDAGILAARALEIAGSRASRIVEELGSTQKYEGVSGAISFDRGTRVNSEAVILKVTATGFVRVQ